MSLERILAHREGNHFASVDTGLRGYKTRHKLAVFLQEENRLADAERQWNLALAEQPAFLPALAGLAEVYLKCNAWPSFDDIVARIHDTGKADLDVQTLQARKHLAQRDFTEARRLIDQAISEKPESLWPRVVLTHILLQEGKDLGAADKALRDVLARDPNHQEARRKLDVLTRQLKAPT